MKTLNSSEVKSFLSGSSKKEPFKFTPHKFVASGFGKQYCVHCGLVAANNKFTQWCVDKGCNNADHNNYEAARKRLTKLF